LKISPREEAKNYMTRIIRETISSPGNIEEEQHEAGVIQDVIREVKEENLSARDSKMT